jgi:hypothetical protein
LQFQCVDSPAPQRTQEQEDRWIEADADYQRIKDQAAAGVLSHRVLDRDQDAQRRADREIFGRLA